MCLRLLGGKRRLGAKAPRVPIHSRHVRSLTRRRALAMNDEPPTLDEIIQLTRQELTTANDNDSIRECGRAALSLLAGDPDTCMKLAYQKLHDVPYKEVKTCWRRLYTDASLWKVVSLLESRKQSGVGEDVVKPTEAEWLDQVVYILDMALILTAASEREELFELWFTALKGVVPELVPVASESERPAKRRKYSPDPVTNIPSTFPTTLPDPSPILRHPIPRTQELSLSAFQTKVSNITTHTPLIIEGALSHWPALSTRPWNNPSYLLTQTLNGRRLVPIELGKSYTDTSWTQRILPFSQFLRTHMLTPNPPETGYLAQHDLFAQIPALRADMSIPDYCFTDPAPSPHLTHIKRVPKLDEPLLNAWFGPAGTVSPLHTDPYHNILAQVVGYKYVRLYAPDQTARMYPRSVDESGVDMSNTSQVDLDDAMSVWSEVSCWPGVQVEEEKRREVEERFEAFRHARYVEAVLGPGECLYVPLGWWHYVRSLTGSFSVSFWFN